MAGLIDDELLEKIAVVAPRNEIARRVRERCADFADRVSFVAPFAPDPECWADVVAELAASEAARLDSGVDGLRGSPGS